MESSFASTRSFFIAPFSWSLSHRIRFSGLIHLHSNNLMIGLVKQDGERVAHRKLECSLKQVEDFLNPHRDQLASLAVESTFNWYWLVDGLRKLDYPIDLANPAKMQWGKAETPLRAGQPIKIARQENWGQ
jgi:hypothetical protein